MIVRPGAVIGIVGGGQLGRMTAQAAARLGYRCRIFTPDADAPAAQVAPATVAPLDDEAALDRFAAAVDVVTIEFENLPVAALRRLARTRPVHPDPDVLAICQDRRAEKDFLVAHDVPVADFHTVSTSDELAGGLAALGGGILKTAREGYDGKGQLRLAADADPVVAWDALGRVPAVLERVIDFAMEISVITARDAAGNLASYVPVENRHRDHILAETLAPAVIPDDLAARAVTLAEAIANGLELVGLIAVEMFVTADGGLVVNELAPRPHNSGHWTMDACAIGQFEQLVRAICGLPLGDPARFADARMVNLLGHDADDVLPILAETGARLHLYGKSEARSGRKMGHVTRLCAARIAAPGCVDTG